MRYLSLLLFALATGCQGTVYYQCGSPHFNEVWSEGPIDCSAFSHNADLAMRMIGQSSHVFHRVHVMVEAGATSLHDHTDADGYYSPNEIHLSTDGHALLHELLHHWEFAHWILNTGEHPQWDAKGYTALDATYELQTVPLVRPVIQVAAP